MPGTLKAAGHTQSAQPLPVCASKAAAQETWQERLGKGSRNPPYAAQCCQGPACPEHSSCRQPLAWSRARGGGVVSLLEVPGAAMPPS